MRTGWRRLVWRLHHGFIGKSPEETREANLHALAATFEFFDKVLGVKAPGVAKK